LPQVIRALAFSESNALFAALESLEEYVLVAQHQCEVTVFRRSAQWNPEVLKQAEQKLARPSLQFTMALRAIYRRVLAL
jgi:hypothetical protein